jgi:hypothetical protein
MSEKAPKLPKSVSPEELKKLIAKHGKGKLFPVTVEKGGQQYCAIAKKPTLAIIDAATSEARDANGIDPMRMMQFVYKNCVVVADPELDQDDELCAGARTAVFGLFKAAKAEVGEAYA